MSVYLVLASRTYGRIWMANPSLTCEWSQDVWYGSRKDSIDIESRPVKLTIDIWSFSRFECFESLRSREVGNWSNMLFRLYYRKSNDFANRLEVGWITETIGSVRRLSNSDSDRLVGSITLAPSTSKLRLSESESDSPSVNVSSRRFFRFYFVYRDLRDWVTLCSLAVSWFKFVFEMLDMCWLVDLNSTWCVLAGWWNWLILVF